MKNKAKKSSFRGKVSKDAGRQTAQGGGFGYLNLPKGVPMYAPVPGQKESIDIIPYIVSDSKHLDRDEEAGIAEVGDLWYKKPIKVHRGVGAENDTVICPKTIGKPCPICEYRATRAKEGADKEELKQYNQSLRNLYVVIPKGNEKRKEIPHIFDMSQFLFQNLLNDELEENEDYEVFPDLEEGYTLRIRWAEESFAGNKYAEANRIDFDKRKKPYDESILEQVPDLDKILKVLSYDTLHAKFFELEHPTGSESDEETPNKKKIAKVVPKSVDEEDDEDDEDYADDGRDTAKVSTKQLSKKVPKPTWEDLIDMDETELYEVCEKYEIELDPEDDDEEIIRNIIAKKLGIELPKTKKQTENSSKKKNNVTEDDEDDDDEEEDEEEEDEEEELPVKKTTKTPAPDLTKGLNKCPYGYRFGVDTDMHKECDKCKIWEKCIDKKEG